MSAIRKAKGNTMRQIDATKTVSTTEKAVAITAKTAMQIPRNTRGMHEIISAIKNHAIRGHSCRKSKESFPLLFL